MPRGARIRMLEATCWHLCDSSMFSCLTTRRVQLLMSQEGLAIFAGSGHDTPILKGQDNVQMLRVHITIMTSDDQKE